LESNHEKILTAPIMMPGSRADVVFVRGEEASLFDDTGKEYIDCLAGIAVVSAGHANKYIADKVYEQLKTLVHVSNLFWNEPIAKLAEKLKSSTGGWGTAFFANSGAEAIECAIKLTRKWGKGRYKILCAEGSFHGRTLGALAATGQPAKWEGFQPLPEGFVHLPFNDLKAFENAVDEKTAAILVEPLQGERGVMPASKDFLEGLRELCNRKNLALIFDEIQSGMGRTGNWWAFQSYGVKPDIFTSAKALANGLPIGVCIADEPFASVLKPGDHASTFGGGPVTAVAALSVFEFFEKEKLLAAAVKKGEYFKSLLLKLEIVKEVRGIGLMIGAVLHKENAKEIVKACLEKGLILNAALPDVIRIVPPLVITETQIQKAVEILKLSA
jgi:acetylornithine/N-succinyldiaminopimelate aminotransferase